MINITPWPICLPACEGKGGGAIRGVDKDSARSTLHPKGISSSRVRENHNHPHRSMGKLYRLMIRKTGVWLWPIGLPILKTPISAARLQIVFGQTFLGWAWWIPPMIYVFPIRQAMHFSWRHLPNGWSSMTLISRD